MQPLYMSFDSDATGSDSSATDRSQCDQYSQIINQTQSIVRDSNAICLAAAHDLKITNITWEDTARYDNASVGPNISDMTIQIEHRDSLTGRTRLSLMPVIRHPNFADLTADVPIQQISVLTGNEKGETTRPTLLAEVLADLCQYLNQSGSWKGDRKSLLAKRDSHVLVSAQAAFLPISEGGEAIFNPVLFNYQSKPEDPAVLTLLATREGTSITVIDNNQRDRFRSGRAWGQRLFFNKNGEKASFTGKRVSDFCTERAASESAEKLALLTATEKEGLNMVMLIQVPLKQKPQERPSYTAASGCVGAQPRCYGALPAPSNVEGAAIGHGSVEGLFTEVNDLEIVRDSKFPIRVTVQFYKATSNGMVSEADLAEINEQIRRVYKDADYAGSLVTDRKSAGAASPAENRPTEYEGEHQAPEDWWEKFWEHRED